MKSFATIMTAIAAGLAPTVAALTDADILQFALTLEHLENVFYKGFVSTTPLSTFMSAGYSSFFYDQIKYVAHDEESHVTYLTAGLTAAGAKPVAACTYKFPYTDIKSFIQLASIIEGVGVSAYLGAAPAITTPAYLTAAGSILVTEAIHQSALRGGANEIPMANAYGTPMGPNAVYSIASAFIVSCPSTNAALPFKAYPALSNVQGLPTATGIPFTFSVANNPPAGPLYVVFVAGLGIMPMPATVNGKQITASIPSNPDFTGQAYAFLTNSNSPNLTDSTIIAGPAILEITPNAPTFNLSIV